MSILNSPQHVKVVWSISMVCLAAGLSLDIFTQPDAGPHRNWLHLISGLLVGISLGISLSILLKTARQRRSAKT